MSTTEVTDTTTADAQDDALVFTDAAALKVKELLEDETNDALKLRVFVSGGGCSGFQYGFTFDENVEDGDTLTLTGHAQGDGFRVGFGSCTGKIRPAIDFS